MSKDFFNFRRTSGRIIRTVRFLKGKYEREKQLKSKGEQKVELLTMENKKTKKNLQQNDCILTIPCIFPSCL